MREQYFCRTYCIPIWVICIQFHGFISAMFRSVLTMAIVTVFTTIFGSIAIITGIINPYSWLINRLMISWTNVILWGAGVKISVKGMENINQSESYIYIANHQSLFDILAVIKVLPPPARFIAKKELFSIPVFGWALSAVGMIKIDRSNREKAIISMNRALKTIKGGVSVIIFPEGTRSKDGLIHAFKKGGFVIAIKGKIPVVPVTIYGTRTILRKHSLKLTPGYIDIIIDKPITTEDYSYQIRDTLVDDVREIICKTFDQLKDTHR